MPKEYIPREDVINDIGELFTICRETLPNECGHHFIVEDELQSHLDFVRNLPAADVVELPCRIGDTVWCIRSFRGIDHPQETKVSGMYFTQDMRLNIQCKYVGIGEFGKKVFKTREDAMKAMEGQRA